MRCRLSWLCDRRGALYAPWAVLLLCLVGFAGAQPLAAEPRVYPSWRELPSPQYLDPLGGAIYYFFQTKDGTKVHLIVADTKSDKWHLQPMLNAITSPTSLCAAKQNANAAINGGYFNLSDGKSTSYVVINCRQVADPRTNKALVENPKLSPYLDQIFNRSEIRFLEDSAGTMTIDIATHNAPIPPEESLVHSLQAGPMLLPDMTSRQEAFVRTDPEGLEVDSISSLRRAARTAFGITPDGYVILLCAAAGKQDPESHGLTLAELSDLLRQLGCSKAINLDGGTSTTMVVKNPTSRCDSTTNPDSYRMVCGKEPETHVKSVLLLLPKGISTPD